MYGSLKSQKQWPGWDPICGTASYGPRFPGISIAQLQRTSIINRHFQAIFWKQQREACALREGFEASWLEQQCDYSQGQERFTRERTALRNEKGSKTKQSKLVRADLAIVRLAARDGYIQIGVPKGSISENQYQTSRKWSKGAHDSFIKWSRSMPHYFRKWSYQEVFNLFPTPLSEHYLDLAIYSTLQGGDLSWQ